jgi:hypothetical protein
MWENLNASCSDTFAAGGALPYRLINKWNWALKILEEQRPAGHPDVIDRLAEIY